MDIKEFAALKVGDKITSMNGSAGEVTATTAEGVKVCWAAGALPFFFSAQGTAWFHWSKVQPVTVDDLERHEGDLEDRARG